MNITVLKKYMSLLMVDHNQVSSRCLQMPEWHSPEAEGIEKQSLRQVSERELLLKCIAEKLWIDGHKQSR